MAFEQLAITTTCYPDDPGVDTGLSHAIVRAVGEQRLPQMFRIHRPGRLVAFGRQDTFSPGYAAAVRTARALGYPAVERLAGGRAALFFEDTLAFSWASPAQNPRSGVTERFRLLAEVLAQALADLGLDARIGELPGEYCPGRWSINLGGQVKVAGIGQRLVKGAAHLGGVLVADRGSEVRRILEPVYTELGLEWDPTTAGDVRSFRDSVTAEQIEEAIVARLGNRFRVAPISVPDEVVRAGRSLAQSHLAPAA